MSNARKQRNSLIASKRKLQKNFVRQVLADKLSPEQAVERASVFPVAAASKVLRWPKMS